MYDYSYYLFVGIVSIISLVCNYVIFKRHYGIQGWKALIPIYNVYTISKFTFGSGITMFIPFFILTASMFTTFGIYLIASIGASIFSLIMQYKFAKTLNKSTLIAILVTFLPFIGLPLLAFNKDTKYTGTTTAL